MKVILENGKTATFTQRGVYSSDGFVRVNGKTISGHTNGYRDANGYLKFYAWSFGKNAALARPEATAA